MSVFLEPQQKIEELKQTYLSWSLHESDVRHEGRKEGMKEAKLETARNMLADNIPETTVAKYTNLPIETIQQLAKKTQPEVR